jgi:hypothetical protein
LKDLLTQKDLSREQALLLCLAVDAGNAKATTEVRDLAVSSGLRAAQKWNVSSILARSAGRAVRTAAGWELSAKGSEAVATLAGPLANSPIPKVSTALRSHLSVVQNDHTRRFVEEAIVCFETRQYRAAVVLSWVGAVSLLYDYVVKNRLSDFNQEAAARTATAKSPWKAAKTTDDLARMKESEFLIVLDSISLLGKSVRQQLEHLLNLRNGCGHPNSLDIAEHAVASHLEILILNVFAKF